MIREKQQNTGPIVIDLTGPEGNAFALMGKAKGLAKQLGYDIPENVLTTLIYRWGFFDKSTSLTELKKQITNPDIVDWLSG